MTPAGKTVLVLGYGEMGHAMQVLLDGQHDLHFWDKFPAAGMRNAVVAEVAPQADFVIFCLPASPHREVAEMILPMLKAKCICIGIAKGLNDDGQTAVQVFSDVFGSAGIDYAFLYGPMISEELRAGRHGFAQLACSAQMTCACVRDLFSCSSLLIKRCDDVTGISWSVILKNVYAIVFGIADELRLGDNMRGFLMTAALAELAAIVASMGGDAASPYGLAGLGDLVTTATSPDSHHHELGRRLARGETDNIAGEGVHTLQMVERHGLFEWRQYPLFSLIKHLVAEPESAEHGIVEFARRRFQLPADFPC